MLAYVHVGLFFDLLINNSGHVFLSMRFPYGHDQQIIYRHQIIKTPCFERQTKKATASDISGTIQCAITVNLS